MGWSDFSICLSGPVVEDLKEHFVQRWNFIYDEKYNVRKDIRYCKLAHVAWNVPQIKAYVETPQQELAHATQSSRQFIPGPSLTPEPSIQAFAPPPSSPYDAGEQGRGLSAGPQGGFRDKLRQKAESGFQRVEGELEEHHRHRLQQQQQAIGPAPPTGQIAVQLNRSCAKWSNGVTIEHSIANAYIEVIKNSQHFVYIENQFFITATVDAQKPVKNKIGAAIVERIIRAARNGQKYKIIVVIPAVPGFAGDLKANDALGTRAIMEFQYNSINRGGHSIY
jgi:phospholipase D1/2